MKKIFLKTVFIHQEEIILWFIIEDKIKHTIPLNKYKKKTGLINPVFLNYLVFAQNSFKNYLATLSSHLIINSIVNIEIRQAATNTVQVAQIGMLS
jgi:hypothetical protein